MLAPSHYNRCWNVHNVLSEALERLLLTRFLAETKPTIPDKLLELSVEPNSNDVNEELFEASNQLHIKYENYKDLVRKGSIGKTAQFWLNYMDLMRYQVMAHTAVQENDIDVLLYCWKKFLPMYFSLNKLHYAR